MAAVDTRLTQLRLPEIATQSIYDGKYRDRNPDLKPAGKLTATGDTAELCMRTGQRPESPEVIKRFRATLRPDAGQTRVFYGRAYDPQLHLAAGMVHGVASQPSYKAGELLNPDPNTHFKQSLVDKKESIYASHQRAPLGKSHDQNEGLPSGLDPLKKTFGIKTEKDGSAGELVNPEKSTKEVNEEYEEGRELYRKTHFNYHVGEQCDRAYSSPTYKPDSRFGIPTPHENDGRHVRKTLKWLHDTKSEKTAPVISKRVDEFRERTQPQLGKVHDPIKDTLNVPHDHTFGILVKPDEFGAGDLLHGRGPNNYLRGQERIRGIIGAMRQHLKKANYHNFNDLLSAFKFYDKNGTGRISIVDLHDVCVRFNLPVEPELLAHLMDYCDADRDGFINYEEFANFLNWKDKLPSGLHPKSAPANCGRDGSPMCITKQIDRAIGGHRTSSAMINAIVGGVNTRDYRTYGIPTVRTDLPAPRIKRIDDHTNFGDESDAFGLVNPSTYSVHGIFEKDFLIPRPRSEIFEIFKNINVTMTLDDFDKMYQVAAERHPKGLVSVESFRNVMDEIQAVNLQKTDIL